MWILGLVYLVEFSVEAGIKISYDPLIFTPVLSQMIKSFTEIVFFSVALFGLYTKAISSSWLEADLSWTARYLEVTAL